MPDASPRSTTSQAGAPPVELDVLVVGAGFSGMYLITRLRAMGLSFRVIEAGDDVGGTWYWNRYPGARVDVHSVTYSYSWDKELEQEWQWKERFAPQPELLEYINHVADRHDLRRDISFLTRVEAAHWDEASERWSITTDTGERYAARYCVMAVGCLSVPKLPDFTGLDSFQGDWYHTGLWPHEGVDFTGKRVAVIGTGSTSIQATPQIVKVAEHVTVFQRTPNYSIPAWNRPQDRDEEAAVKAQYPERRQKARVSLAGDVFEPGTTAIADTPLDDVHAELERRWQLGGFTFLVAFTDVLMSRESNEIIAEFVRNKIRGIVKDPATAELLCPRNFFGTKRMCVDTGYYEIYNRDNITLYDAKTNPITGITATGVQTTQDEVEVDAIVFAIGYDAMTGPLFNIDIRGRDGVSLKEKWSAGPRTYLGLGSHGFPNLFTITGPQSPSVLSNMLVSIEQHVDFVSDTIAYLEQNGLHTIEPELDAEDAWVDHCRELGDSTLHPHDDTWYMGANIPGKPRVFMPYIGGVGTYREKCDEVAAAGYEGYALT